MIVRMNVTDPFGTLASNLLAGDVAVTVRDADSSWLVTRTVTGCVQTRSSRFVCRPNSDLRAVFKRVRNSADQWSMRLVLRALTDTETGPTMPADNPLEAPVHVNFENGPDLSIAQINTCTQRRYFVLVCKVP
jgi:hypothetical protein